MRFAIQDHGCKVNRYDGELVRAELRHFGLVEAAPDEHADVVVVNACAVTDRAVRRGRQALRRMRREHPDCRMVVTGCMTDRDRAAYAAIDDGVLVVPSKDKERLRSGLADLLETAIEAHAAHGLDGDSFDDRTRAYLKVQDGCDAHCSFCVIPQIRGGARSRARTAILAEAQALVDRGFRELVVCGIHLGHYGRDTGDDLATLATELSQLDGAYRLRLSSLEVGEVDDRLVEAVLASGRIVPHFHIPMQSGDDDVLRRMRRPYTARRFLERIELLRRVAGDVAITTDVIVGFPGECDAAFERTLAAVAQAAFAKVHVFPYSPREGTDAARLDGRVAMPTLRARVARLLELDTRLSADFGARLVGTRADVLIHRPGDATSQGLCARHRRVRIAGRFERGTFVRCVVRAAHGDVLIAEPEHVRV